MVTVTTRRDMICPTVSEGAGAVGSADAADPVAGMVMLGRAREVQSSLLMVSAGEVKILTGLLHECVGGIARLQLDALIRGGGQVLPEQIPFDKKNR